MNNIPSSIKDNNKRGSVGEFLKEKIVANSKLSIVSAYFTIYAYEKLNTQLDKIDNLKFLFGEPTFLKNVDPDKSDSKSFAIEDDKLEIPISKRLEQKAVAKECVEWIKEKVSIKSMKKPKFLHGKMYHLEEDNGIQHSIMGSSNFTVRGLGLNNNPNIELNMVITDERDKRDLKSWFDEVWNNDNLVEDVKAKVISYISQLYTNKSPEFIYFKTLFHIFEEFLKDQKKGGLLDQKTGFLDSDIWKMLYSFQKDCVKGAINKIINHNGCIIADSVGLGKTFEALAVIKYFELMNSKVLVLCPKRLENNWLQYQAQNNSKLNPLINDRLSFSVLSHTDLSRNTEKANGESVKVNGIDLSTINWSNYDLVVIDESHNFRNNKKGRRDEDGNIIRKSRYERLMNDIINSGITTKVLLLSATPVNNTLKDLRNQMLFITGNSDTAFSETMGISNISNTIKNAQREFTKWAKEDDRNTKKLFENLGSDFFKLLDELTIARSRKHIKSYYKDELKELHNFPKRLPVISKAPSLDTEREDISYDELNEMIMRYKLYLFNPSAFIKDEYKEIYVEKSGVKGFSQMKRESFLIGMMKVNYLKRLESSVESFRISINNTIEKIKKLEEKIFNFKEKECIDLDEYETPDFYDEEDDEMNDANSVGKKLKFKLEHLHLEKWILNMEEDKKALLKILESVSSIDESRDKKLFTLKELIREKINNPINIGNKKVIIFTAFSDTATYLYENLRNFAKNELDVEIALIVGSGTNKTTLGNIGFDDILTNFSPKSKNRDRISGMPDKEIDILIATDCISEGQNLQDCDYLINYDIHWNPVRIIQRFGRIDRLNSQNKKVQLVNFWPTEDLNKYINLKDRVESKMALVDITATGEENILDQSQVPELIEEDMKFRNKQLKRLKNEVLDLEEIDENISLSEFTLDDFRMELSNYIEKNRKQLEEAPLGLYAVVPSPKSLNKKETQLKLIEDDLEKIVLAGVIFCFRQLGDTDGNEKLNPLSPYFLVYIRDDGTIRYNYTHPKQILEIFKALASGKEEAYKELCDIFDKETEDGKKMKKYNELLERSLENIKRLYTKKSFAALTKSRNAKLIFTDDKEKKSHFELITWLVIKG